MVLSLACVTVESFGFPSVVMLESANDRVLGVDTLRQQMLPRV
jgi:hypothetical protein